MGKKRKGTENKNVNYSLTSSPDFHIYWSNVFNTLFLTLIPIDIYSSVEIFFSLSTTSIRDSKILHGNVGTFKDWLLCSTFYA